MCNESCLDFGKKSLKEEYIRDKSVIEVGSIDINGSLRPFVELFKPREYIGVDIQMGPGVDQICEAENLISKFGCNRFDVLICTEVLEHVRDWREVVHNLKQIIKPSGILLITTRSKGFHYHGFPFDFWRYEISDIETIFSDFNIKTLQKDEPKRPGIFLLAMKPQTFIENRVANLNLCSPILDKRLSVIRASIYCKIIRVLFKMLKIKDYYIERIIHYNNHPLEILAMITRKLKNK